MRAAELGAARVAIWGLGREGQAAIRFLRARHPELPLLLLDDAADAQAPARLDRVECAFGARQIARALGDIDVIVKSPGVSLYRPEIESARGNGVEITSLLNLWFAERVDLTTICVTGTKGKSTTASLVAHMLGKLGRRVALVGNIGVPITAIDATAADYAVIEVSSYQAADFDGVCDVAVLTSLFPEHLDWHRTLEAYYRDKLNLLRHSRRAIVNREASATVGATRLLPSGVEFFNDEGGVHRRGVGIFDGAEPIGEVRNRYLARAHNTSNLCAALTVAKALGMDPAPALVSTLDFAALPHREQELGVIGEILYVDDSISTAPESTLAALSVYAGHAVTVIVGGHDRGIDYGKLVEALAQGAARSVICLGASGERIYSGLRDAAKGSGAAAPAAHRAQSMQDAVARARRLTPAGGVVLLSPAAPSYGYYRDFAERGRDFAYQVGRLAEVREGSG
jgi:UDP-N-acetylmuramoyl-L-alanine---L-glutamate ligase